MNLPRIKSHNLVSAPKVTVHQNSPNTNAIMPSFPPLIHSTFATNSCPRINSKALQARSSGDTKISPKSDPNVQAVGLMGWGLKGLRRFVGSLGDIHWYSSCFCFKGNETWLKKFHRRFFHGKDPIEDQRNRVYHWRMHRLAMIHIPLVLKANM